MNDLSERLYLLGHDATPAQKRERRLRLLRYLTSPMPLVRYGALMGLSYVVECEDRALLMEGLKAEPSPVLRGLFDGLLCLLAERCNH